MAEDTALIFADITPKVAGGLKDQNIVIGRLEKSPLCFKPHGAQMGIRKGAPTSTHFLKCFHNDILR